MSRYSILRAEFRQLETKAALGEDVNATLAKLILRVERVTKAVASLDWRQEVEGLRGTFRVRLLALSEADEGVPPLARSSMQLRKKRFVEAAVTGLTTLLVKPSP